ncbi:MAG: hypothetical protein ACLS7Z_01395 [Christensenellales bacterium]
MSACWAKATRRSRADHLPPSSAGVQPGQLLAEHLGEIWGMPVLPALSRKDEHTAQMKLSAESRRSNLADCMRPTPPSAENASCLWTTC